MKRLHSSRVSTRKTTSSKIIVNNRKAKNVRARDDVVTRISSAWLQVGAIFLSPYTTICMVLESPLSKKKYKNSTIYDDFRRSTHEKTQPMMRGLCRFVRWSPLCWSFSIQPSTHTILLYCSFFLVAFVHFQNWTAQSTSWAFKLIKFCLIFLMKFLVCYFWGSSNPMCYQR